MKKAEVRPGMEVAIVPPNSHRTAQHGFVIEAGWTHVRSYRGPSFRRSAPRSGSQGVAVATTGYFRRDDPENTRWVPEVVPLSHVTPWAEYQAKETAAQEARRIQREQAQQQHVIGERARADRYARFEELKPRLLAHGITSSHFNGITVALSLDQISKLIELAERGLGYRRTGADS